LLRQDWPVESVHLLSAALLIPGYRLCPSILEVDKVLNKRYRNLIDQLARQQVEQSLKRLLFVDGRYGINNSDLNLTSDDRAIVMLAMGQRGLDFSERAHLADFTSSAVTSNLANGGHPKTGQRKRHSGQELL
jgi:hypothetical protein